LSGYRLGRREAGDLVAAPIAMGQNDTISGNGLQPPPSTETATLLVYLPSLQHHLATWPRREGCDRKHGRAVGSLRHTVDLEAHAGLGLGQAIEPAADLVAVGMAVIRQRHAHHDAA
jgi:hypothetical protein